MTRNVPSDSPSRGVKLWGGILAAAILVWGSFIAVGAYLADDERHPGKPLIILGCTLLFVVLWIFVWRAAAKRSNRHQHR